MDGYLGHRHDNTAGIQKWVNLLDHMLHAFKGNGHCVTMDSAYMGNIMAMIGRDVWKIDMVGMAQTNRTGADVANKISWMKKGNIQIHLLAARNAAAMFCGVVGQCPHKNFVQFSWTGSS